MAARDDPVLKGERERKNGKSEQEKKHGNPMKTVNEMITSLRTNEEAVLKKQKKISSKKILKLFNNFTKFLLQDRFLRFSTKNSHKFRLRKVNLD